MPSPTPRLEHAEAEAVRELCDALKETLDYSRAFSGDASEDEEDAFERARAVWERYKRAAVPTCATTRSNSA